MRDVDVSLVIIVGKGMTFVSVCARRGIRCQSGEAWHVVCIARLGVAVEEWQCDVFYSRYKWVVG